MNNQDEANDFKRDISLLERSYKKIIQPFDDFIESQRSAGIVLLLAAILAMVAANSGYQQLYDSINSLPLSIGLGQWEISYSLHHWVNDGLMVLFFFVLGLEIKQECLVGELANISNASLVIIMAIGGMLLPAGIYALVANSGDALRGWGIPMATDTAFALGILAFLHRRVPRAVVVILSALAIVDDIGAVMVISLFYTEQIYTNYLLLTALTLSVLFIGNVVGIRSAFFYLVGGVLVWWFILHSGIHATTAGILLALTIPARPNEKTLWFIRRMRKLINRFEEIDDPKKSILEQSKQHELAERAQQITNETTTPLQRWGSLLDKPISLTILPLFAFLNAGVMLTARPIIPSDSSVMMATATGLVIGKVIGINLFAWLCLRLKIAKLPEGLKFIHITGLSFLAGIGFTMSLFISTLAFEGHPELLAQAKLGILIGSLIAGVLGTIVFLIAGKDRS